MYIFFESIVTWVFYLLLFLCFPLMVIYGTAFYFETNHQSTPSVEKDRFVWLRRPWTFHMNRYKYCKYNLNFINISKAISCYLILKVKSLTCVDGPSPWFFFSVQNEWIFYFWLFSPLLTILCPLSWACLLPVTCPSCLCCSRVVPTLTMLPAWTTAMEACPAPAPRPARNSTTSWKHSEVWCNPADLLCLTHNIIQTLMSLFPYVYVYIVFSRSCVSPGWPAAHRPGAEAGETGQGRHARQPLRRRQVGWRQR